MLLPDSPLQIGSKTLVLREHRDRFSSGSVNYDDMPESIGGEMIMKSNSVIDGGERVYVLIKRYLDEGETEIKGRPYLFPHFETAETVSQGQDGLSIYISLGDFLHLLNAPGAPNLYASLLIDGDIIINGLEIKRTNPTTQMTVVTISYGSLPWGITAGIYLKADASLVGALHYQKDSDDITAMYIKTIGTGNYVAYGYSSNATPPTWAGRVALTDINGTLPSYTSINLYDGNISNYLALPYMTYTIDANNRMADSILFIYNKNAIGSYSITNLGGIVAHSITDAVREFNTTATLPLASYTFTTSGIGVPLKTIADLVITQGRPDSETNTRFVITWPQGSENDTLPDNEDMTPENIRDYIYTKLPFFGILNDWTIAKVGTNTIRFTSLVYGPLVGNTYSINFDDGAITLADGTFTRTQQGGLPASRIPLNEPKLYTSQFYLPTITLDGVTVPIYREYIPDNITALPITLTYNSSLEDVAMKVGSDSYFKMLNEGVRIIQMPNRMPLYASDVTDYYQYLKEYDDRLFNIQQTAIARNAALGAVNSALSAVVPMVGAETVSTGIAGTRIARAGINITNDILNAVDNYKSNTISRQKALMQLSLSSIDIASTSAEFLIANDLDQIQFYN